MDKLIPWKQLEKKVARYYPKGQTCRPPYAISAMLHVHCTQLFYNLSDPVTEDALYEIESMRHFAGLKLDRLPDEIRIFKFRHLLEERGLGKVLFKEVNKRLEKHGLMLREGSIVDAGYLGIRKRDGQKHRKDVSWFISKRPGIRKKLDADKLKAEKVKASIRAKAEQPLIGLWLRQSA